MTTLPEAVQLCERGELHAILIFARSERNRAADDGRRGWAAIQNALLCAVSDELKQRASMDADIMEVLDYGRIVPPLCRDMEFVVSTDVDGEITVEPVEEAG